MIADQPSATTDLAESQPTPMADRKKSLKVELYCNLAIMVLAGLFALSDYLDGRPWQRDFALAMFLAVVALGMWRSIAVLPNDTALLANPTHPGLAAANRWQRLMQVAALGLIVWWLTLSEPPPFPALRDWLAGLAGF